MYNLWGFYEEIMRMSVPSEGIRWLHGETEG